MSFEDLLACICDTYLGPCKGEPVTSVPEGGRLVYQDETCCSASSALSDVYCMPDGSFEIRTDVGLAQCTGGSHDHKLVINKCTNLLGVMDALVAFSFHDPNGIGEFATGLGGDKRLCEFSFSDYFKDRDYDRLLIVVNVLWHRMRG